MYVSFSVYVPVAQEKQSSQERVVHAVFPCQFFLRATGECLGVDFCAHVILHRGREVGALCGRVSLAGYLFWW